MEKLFASLQADFKARSNSDTKNLVGYNGNAEDNGDLADIEALNYDDDLDSIIELQKTQRYADIMKRVEDALDNETEMSNLNMVEGDPEYHLIVDCTTLLIDIEEEIAIVHNFIRHKYRLKFPELECLVHDPIYYARVIKKIGNEVNLNLVDLEGLLPLANIKVISFTASTTIVKPLPEDVLQMTIKGCDRALTLYDSKKKILDVFESKMRYVSSSYTALFGGAVVAKLVVAMGGLGHLVN